MHGDDKNLAGAFRHKRRLQQDKHVLCGAPKAQKYPSAVIAAEGYFFLTHSLLDFILVYKILYNYKNQLLFLMDAHVVLLSCQLDYNH